MTRYPSDTPGAAVLTAAPRAPRADAAKALHAEYFEVVERFARSVAGVDPRPAPLPDGDCPLVDAMFEAETQIMAEPTQSLAMLALRLMATFCTYQRCEDDNTNTLDPLRQMRDEAAALAGLAVVDEFAAIERLGGAA